MPEHAFMIWSPVCELPYGPRSFIAASSEAGQMAAPDYVPIFFKNRLHLAGRPQMSTRPSVVGPMKSVPRGDREARPGADAGPNKATKWPVLRYYLGGVDQRLEWLLRKTGFRL